MFITTQKYSITGNGGLTHVDIKLNVDEISSIVECGYEHRQYTGLRYCTMKNGDKFYTSLELDDLP